MKTHTQTDLSKLQVVASLFADTHGDDLYLARQIKESIEAALPPEEIDDIGSFVQAAEKLLQSARTEDGKYAIRLVPAHDKENFSLLTLREKLLAALKQTCRFERPLLVLTGLKDAICPKGARWNKRRKLEYEEAISFVRAFCVSRSRPSAKLNLIIL